MNYLSNTLLLAVTTYLLVHFGLIVKWGSYTIQEPNTFILYGEILLLAAIIVYSLVRLALTIRR